MSTPYSVFDPTTGAITYAVADGAPPEGQDDIVPYQIDGAEFWVTADYEVVPRPELAVDVNKYEVVADATDHATLSGIPAGARLVLGPGYPVQIADGTPVEFFTDIVGPHTLVIDAFPAKTLTVVIHGIA